MTSLLILQLSILLTCEPNIERRVIYLPYVYVIDDSAEGESSRTSTPKPKPAEPTNEPPVIKYPPQASININRESREAGISTFCWTKIGCVDSLYFATQKDSLYSSDHITATFRFVTPHDPTRMIVYINEMNDECEISIPNSPWRWWNGGINIKKFDLSSDVPRVLDTRLDDGVYLILLKAIWGPPYNLGDVEYGFLLKVSRSARPAMPE